MNIQFWGTRGSAATPDDDKLSYGGNTCSIVITSPQMPQHFFILDAGTGLARFGSTLNLMEHYTATLLLCHLHLYHIIGFQFSPFAFSPHCKTLVIGPNTRNFALESVFDHIMASTYSPVYGLQNLMARVDFQEVVPDPLPMGAMTITAAPFRHSKDSSSWGYRLECDGRVVVYITDAALRQPDGRLVPQALYLAQGADVLIGGAFDPEFERPERTTYRDILAVAQECGINHIYLSHHHPEATDQHLDRIQENLHHHHPNLSIHLAREGMVIDL